MPDQKMYEFAHLFKPSAYKSEELANGVKQNLDELQTFYDKAMAKITQIRRNTGLTLIGKQDAFAKLKADLTKELQEWNENRKGYAVQIERIEAEAKPTRHRQDDPVYEQRQREIRDILRTLDVTEIEARVREAAETGVSAQ